MGLATEDDVRSRKAWYFIFVTIIITAIVFCLVLSLYVTVNTDDVKLKGPPLVWHHAQKPHTEYSVQEESESNCSEVCQQMSTAMLSKVDTSFDPCENFYSFACGSYISKFNDSVTVSSMMDMEETMKYSIEDLLKSVRDPQEHLFGKLKHVYDSCIKEISAEENAVPTFLQYLARFGMRGWPHLEQDYRFSYVSLAQAVGQMAAYDVSFVKFASSNHDFDNDAPLLNLTVSVHSPLLSSMFHDEPYANFYEEFMLDVLDYFGADNESALSITKDVMEVDTEFKAAFESSLKSAHDQSSTLDCAEDNAQHVNLLCDILKNFISYSNLSSIYSSRFLQSDMTTFANNVALIIANANERKMANYLALRFLLESLDSLDSFLRSVLLRLPVINTGVSEYFIFRDRRRHCIKWITYKMTYPLTKLYVVKRLGISIGEISSIFSAYTSAAGELVDSQMWIDQEQRQQIKSTLENLNNILEFYVSEISQDSKLDAVLDEFSPTDLSFFYNAMQLSKETLKFKLKNSRLLSSKEKIITEYRPFAVNAGESNGIIELKFGFLQSPVFEHGRPNLLNLFTLGHGLAHEMGHVFFSQMQDLKSISTKAIYDQKSECLMQQYSEYDIKKIRKKVKGKDTFVENLADMFALQLMEKVSKTFLNRFGEEAKFSIKGLDFNIEKLLYISFGQMWCGVTSREVLRRQFKIGQYPPDEIRVIGMLRNSKAFPEAFRCLKDSFMNPSDKCLFFE